MRARRLPPPLSSLLFVACTSGDPITDAGTPDSGATDSGATDAGAPALPARYAFDSRFGAGSSVRYGGQAFRQVLIADLKSHIGGLTARIDQGTLVPAAGAVKAELEFYFDFDVATSGDVEIGLATTPPRKQTTYREISASGANLKGKIAGNDDPALQHRDWNTEGVIGWPGSPSPEALVRGWFEELDRLAVDRANGTIPKDPSGADLTKVHVSAAGHDLRELIQKFLDGAVSYSQGTDDYLDDVDDGKGLNTDNTKADGTNPYTALEHAWDEGFGYFGAARDYGDYTDDELAAAGGRPDYAAAHHDTDGDGAIDVTAEVNYGHSTSAAKRDRGSKDGAKTDYTAEAWEAFRRGRMIITSAGGALSAAQMAELKAARDQAVLAWEKSIAASVVHYINQVLVDLGKIGGGEYEFEDHVKHWSELKGFALALQFNPRAKLSADGLRALHDEIGDRPVVAGGDVEGAKTKLRQAKARLGDAYGFQLANLGDADGKGGW